jgi:hypothetical protein
MKKPYEKPAIVSTEKITSRVTVCISSDEACRTNGGPIQS